MKNCDHCGKETNNPRFCSRTCSAKVTNVESPKRATTKICSKCTQKVKSHRHTLCSEHFEIWKERFRQESTIGEYRSTDSVKGKHPSWVHSHIRGFARSWLKHLTKQPCAFCGYDKHVELAHIKPVSEFSDDAKIGQVNAESNVIQLCRNCHWEFDHLDRDQFKDKLIELEKDF